MPALYLLLLFWLQAPGTTGRAVVGLVNGTQLTIDNPQFSGFIETREAGEPFLLYRQENFYGEISMRVVSRIDFGKYKRGKPFRMTLTLRDGRKIQAQTDRRDFVMIKGASDLGNVTVKHPDPIASEVKLSTRKPNRKDDLTIQYLEFPAP